MRTVVVSSSMVPKRNGDRVKTDRRDSLMLARLLFQNLDAAVTAATRGMTTVGYVPTTKRGDYPMNTTSRRLTRAVVISVTLWLTSGVARAQDCQPGFDVAAQPYLAVYLQLVDILYPQLDNLTAGLSQVVDQNSYATFLAQNRQIVATLPGSRMLVTVPDGTVVLDTARPDDPDNMLTVGNSYQHFQQKTVNENHNSRVAVFAAQLYPCGYGLESKLSSTTGLTESYIALRLGNHLDSIGTARISIVAP